MVEQPVDCGAQRFRRHGPPPASIRRQSTRRGCPSGGVAEQRVSAAVRPLRTADSIVAGQPVSVHAPAITRLESAVVGPGRRTPGAGMNVASGSRVAAPRSKCARARPEGSTDASAAAAELDEFAAPGAAHVVGGTQAAAHVSGRLLEDPLHRRVEQRCEVAAEHRAVVPEMHVDDRHRPRMRRVRRSPSDGASSRIARETAAVVPR